MLLSLSLISGIKQSPFWQIKTESSSTNTRSAVAILNANKFAANALPLKIRALLDHKEKMTLVLKEKMNLGDPIKIEALSSSFFQDTNEYIRTVILKDCRSDKPFSLGIIKIDFNELKDFPELKKQILEAESPFGQLLQDHNLDVTGNPDIFYKISDQDDKNELFSFLPEKSKTSFGLCGSQPLYGRHNTLARNDTGVIIAEVYEFLAI